jgi:glyoxylase-like metal-dependent hydrolase (beta-lactamase superfamily II)
MLGGRLEPRRRGLDGDMTMGLRAMAHGVAGTLVLSGLVWLTVTGPGAAQAAQSSQGDLELMQVAESFFVIAGAGSNIGVQVGEDGVVLVDSGRAGAEERVLALVRSLTSRPIRFIINTSADADHVAGNEALSKAGASVVSPANAFNAIFSTGQAQIISHEAVLARMGAPTGATPAFPSGAWPTSTYADRQKVMWINDEGIQVMHRPAAHSDGDSIVHFRRNDVIMVGDLIDMTRFPRIEVDRGGSIGGLLAALNDLIERAIPVVPLEWRDGGTKVVPGHGWPGEQADVVEYRDMVTIVRDRVADQLRKGRSLQEIQATNPTAGYTTRYSRQDDGAAAREFVESIHRSLTSPRN